MPPKKHWFNKRKGNNPRTPNMAIFTSYTIPAFHSDIMDAVSAEIPSVWFCDINDNLQTTNEYDTNIMGSFTCNNRACAKKTWTSKKVAILIRGYPANGYNAEVFNQRCKSCNHLGQPIVDKQSYVDRVVYRLKKWANVPVELPYYEGVSNMMPHESELCEGCMRGLCQKKGT